MRTYQELDVWQLGIVMVKEIYEATMQFPNTEQYVLGNQ